MEGTTENDQKAQEQVPEKEQVDIKEENKADIKGEENKVDQPDIKVYIKEDIKADVKEDVKEPGVKDMEVELPSGKWLSRFKDSSYFLSDGQYRVDTSQPKEYGPLPDFEINHSILSKCTERDICKYFDDIYLCKLKPVEINGIPTNLWKKKEWDDLVCDFCDETIEDHRCRFCFNCFRAMCMECVDSKESLPVLECLRDPKGVVVDLNDLECDLCGALSIEEKNNVKVVKKDKGKKKGKKKTENKEEKKGENKETLREFYSDRENDKDICGDCYRDKKSELLRVAYNYKKNLIPSIEKQYGFGSLLEWVPIMKDSEGYLLCNLDKGSEFYNRTALMYFDNERCACYFITEFPLEFIFNKLYSAQTKRSESVIRRQMEAMSLPIYEESDDEE